MKKLLLKLANYLDDNLTDLTGDETVGVEQAPIAEDDNIVDHWVVNPVPIIAGAKYNVIVKVPGFPMRWVFEVEASSDEQAKLITINKINGGEFELRTWES